MRSKILQQSRFNFYFPFVWGPLLVIGFCTFRDGSFQEWKPMGLGEPSFLIVLLAIVMGVGLFNLGLYVRQLAKANEELANEVKIQNERIWRLEDALTQLNSSRTQAN